MRIRGIPALKGQSHRSIELAARGLRNDMYPGRPAEVGLSGVDLFDDAQDYFATRLAPVFGFELRVVDLPLGPPGLASYEASSNTVVVRVCDKTYRGLVAGEGRAVFTLSHELAHVVMHLRELIRLQALPHVGQALARGSKSHEIFMDTEWQADAFAAAFLMPAQGVEKLEQLHRWLDPSIISSTFGTSHQAAELRLETFRRRRVELCR